MKSNDGFPLFFKLWFAFIAIVALCIVGGYIFAAVKIFGTLQGASPETVGAAVGKAVAAFQKAQQ